MHSNSDRLPVTFEYKLTSRIVAAYQGWLVRLYCRIRFFILRRRFLEEVGQYLPASGNAVDIGCGYGLFTLYFASTHPQLSIFGIDSNGRRIEKAKQAAIQLGISNAAFEAIDAQQFLCKGALQAAYLMDLVHHIPYEAVEPLVREIVVNLEPGGCLIIKDVDSRPRHKMAFTWLLDKLMDYRAPVRYWSQAEMTAMMQNCGLQAVRHAMIDFLPYPHVIYVGRKSAAVTSPRTLV